MCRLLIPVALFSESDLNLSYFSIPVESSFFICSHHCVILVMVSYKLCLPIVSVEPGLFSKILAVIAQMILVLCFAGARKSKLSRKKPYDLNNDTPKCIIRERKLVFEKLKALLCAYKQQGFTEYILKNNVLCMHFLLHITKVAT